MERTVSFRERRMASVETVDMYSIDTEASILHLEALYAVQKRCSSHILMSDIASLEYRRCTIALCERVSVCCHKDRTPTCTLHYGSGETRS